LRKNTAELVILLAPIGAGKSTRVRHFRNIKDGFVLVSEDEIVGRLIRRRGIDVINQLTEPSSIESPKGLNDRTADACHAMYQQEAVPAYKEQLHKALTGSTQHVVVDFPTTNRIDMLDHTIERAKEAGRQVVLEGIYVNPASGMSRTLQRDSYVLGEDDAHKLTLNRNYLNRLLSTYQRFPDQFMQAAAQADKVRLFDNDTPSERTQKLVAEWPHSPVRTQPVVHDSEAYASFLGLSKIEIPNPHLSARLLWSQIQGDDWCHSYQVLTEPQPHRPARGHAASNTPPSARA